MLCCVLGHRIAQYEAHIERLSKELVEARSHALELQHQSTAAGSEADQIEDLQRHVGLLRSKEAKLEAQVAELEARLERRLTQLMVADGKVSGLEEQLEGLRAELREARGGRADLRALRRQSMELPAEVEELQDALAEANGELDRCVCGGGGAFAVQCPLHC